MPFIWQTAQNWKGRFRLKRLKILPSRLRWWRWPFLNIAFKKLKRTRAGWRSPNQRTAKGKPLLNRRKNSIMKARFKPPCLFMKKRFRKIRTTAMRRAAWARFGIKRLIVSDARARKVSRRFRNKMLFFLWQEGRTRHWSSRRGALLLWRRLRLSLCRLRYPPLPLYPLQTKCPLFLR